MQATSPNQVGQKAVLRYIISFVCSTNMSEHCKYMYKHNLTCSLNAWMGYFGKQQNGASNKEQ